MRNLTSKKKKNNKLSSKIKSDRERQGRERRSRDRRSRERRRRERQGRERQGRERQGGGSAGTKKKRNEPKPKRFLPPQSQERELLKKIFTRSEKVESQPRYCCRCGLDS